MLTEDFQFVPLVKVNLKRVLFSFLARVSDSFSEIPHWCYCQPAELWFDDHHVLASAGGDPWGPCFSLLRLWSLLVL